MTFLFFETVIMPPDNICREYTSLFVCEIIENWIIMTLSWPLKVALSLKIRAQRGRYHPIAWIIRRSQWVNRCACIQTGFSSFLLFILLSLKYYLPLEYLLPTLFTMFRDLLLFGFRRPSLRKQPFLLAPRRWGRFAGKNVSRLTSLAAEEQKWLFSQANVGQIEVAFLNLLWKPDCNL